MTEAVNLAEDNNSFTRFDVTLANIIIVSQSDLVFIAIMSITSADASNSLGILSDTSLNQSKSKVHVQTVLSPRVQCQKMYRSCRLICGKQLLL